MDPNNLDPKLKATYERVMGTQTAPAQPSPAAAPPAPASPTPNPMISKPVTPVSPVSTSPTTPGYASDNLNFQAAIQTPAITTPIAAQGTIIPQKQTSALLKILYIIGAIVFFVAYTYLWIKIFNLPIPFLN